MLEALFGSIRREQVLLFLQSRGEGYARQIARHFNSSLDPIQKQLDRLESGGVIVSRTAGRTRLYEWNPRYPFLRQLSDLLAKALSFYPAEEQDGLTMDRRRPRRRGKPL